MTGTVTLFQLNAIEAERDTIAATAHLNPIERLWGLMHKHVTHNWRHKHFTDFRAEMLTFLREKVAEKWNIYCDEVTNNFRIISPEVFEPWREQGKERAKPGWLTALGGQLDVMLCGL